GVKIGKGWVNSGSLFEYLTATVSDIDRHDKKALEHRKNILQTLGKKLILSFFKKPWKGLKIIRLINKGFQIKDLQIYEADRAHSDFVVAEGQDFFALIENNYLGLKSNRYIYRSIQHDSFICDE